MSQLNDLNNLQRVWVPTPPRTPRYYADTFGNYVKSLLIFGWWLGVAVVALGVLIIVIKAVLFFVRAALQALGIG